MESDRINRSFLKHSPNLPLFDKDIEENRILIKTGDIWVSESKNSIFIRDKGQWIDTKNLIEGGKI